MVSDRQRLEEGTAAAERVMYVLLKAPPDQMDPQVKSLLRMLATRDVASWPEALTDIIRFASHYGLVSSFTMVTLESFQQMTESLFDVGVTSEQRRQKAEEGYAKFRAAAEDIGVYKGRDECL